jgi:hypothetical protein
MFGSPIPCQSLDRDAVILPWVWTYLHKIDPNSLEEVEKARGTCNGGKRHGRAVTLKNPTPADDDYEAHIKKTANDVFVLVLRQVDDFAISGSNTDKCNKVRQTIQNQIANELHNLGIIKRFNGLDIHQTRDYLKISCELCVDKINTHHRWRNKKAADRPIPMRNDAACQATLELAAAPKTEKEQ